MTLTIILFLGLCPLSGIAESTEEYDVSETGPVSVLR
jgi:hypothetical protein